MLSRVPEGETRGSKELSSFASYRGCSGRYGGGSDDAIVPSSQALRGSLVFDDSTATFRALEKRSRRTVVPGTDGSAVGDGITDAVDTAKLSFVGW